jgi:HAD superfamily hydrolase (TIGR01490 family)
LLRLKLVTGRAEIEIVSMIVPSTLLATGRSLDSTTGLTHGERVRNIVVRPALHGADRGSRGEVAAVFDLDGTITRNDTFAAFLSALMLRRPWRMPAFATLPLAFGVHRLGFRDNAWLKSAALWAVAGGCRRDRLDRLTDRLVSRSIRPRIRPLAERRIEEHRRRGHRLVLATASFDFYVGKIARLLGFDDLVCSHAHWTGTQRLSGRIDGFNCHGVNKLDRVRPLFDPRRDWWVVSYSDHVSDLPLLEWSDEPVAVSPERELRAVARDRGWPIEDW